MATNINMTINSYLFLLKSTMANKINMTFNIIFTYDSQYLQYQHLSDSADRLLLQV